MSDAGVQPAQGASSSQEVTPAPGPVPMGAAVIEGDKPTPIDPDYAEFEIGHHQVPWFLWLFFGLIVSWASVSWIKFFGY